MTEPTKEAQEIVWKIKIWAELDQELMQAAIEIDAFTARRVAEERERLEDPPEAVIARGVQMLNTPRSGPDETLVHDIWQAMLDEFEASHKKVVQPRK